MTIILFIFILALLIFVHELGHFLAAKLCGIRVDEFGLGFPPRAVSWKRGETVYSLNFIPFGGFVKIFGETLDEASATGPDCHRSLVAKPKWQQALVLVAGVFSNWLLAWFFISAGFMFGLPLSADNAAAEGLFLSNVETTIVQVRPDSPAARAGLKAGDAVTYITTAKINITKPAVAVFQEAVKTAPDVITIGYRRGEKTGQATLTPTVALAGRAPVIGVALDEIGILKLPWYAALSRGSEHTLTLTKSLLFGLSQMVSGLFAGESLKDAVIGPIGIAGLVGEARALGFIYLLTFAAFISLDLAIINLIPFPALDGGRLLFLLIEAVKGSPLKPAVANTLNLAGFIFLIALMIAVTASDIFRLF